MKNARFASYTIPHVARWVREAVRLEARRTGTSASVVLEACIERALDPVTVDLAKARARAKIAYVDMGSPRSRAALLTYLRSQPIEIAREKLRKAALAPKPPRTVDPGLVGPGEAEDDEAMPTTVRGRRTFLRDAPES